MYNTLSVRENTRRRGFIMQKMTKKEYGKYIKEKSPKSPLLPDMLKAFLVGGIICTIGQAVINGWKAAGLDEENAASATCVTLVFLGVLFTALGVYDRIARFAGAGTLVPITGFANAVSSPALEYKAEGFVSGMAAKMFVIAGPVIVFGLTASVIYGVVYWLTLLLK